MAGSYESTRRNLHGAAELLLAGPRYAGGGSIQLRVGDGGISTWDSPRVSLHAGQLVSGGQRVDLDGLTFADAASRAGLVARTLGDVYHDGPGFSVGDLISLDPSAAALVEDALALGDQALRAFAPSADPILWPEHFDVGITAGDVNYGVSPGDSFHPQPYAYVGPHQPRTGPFWNAPFGACRSLEDLADVASLVAFFEHGKEEAAG
jgi:hypothetical protein